LEFFVGTGKEFEGPITRRSLCRQSGTKAFRKLATSSDGRQGAFYLLEETLNIVVGKTLFATVARIRALLQIRRRSRICCGIMHESGVTYCRRLGEHKNQKYLSDDWIP
jgi:hypothetical protein